MLCNKNIYKNKSEECHVYVLSVQIAQLKLLGFIMDIRNVNEWCLNKLKNTTILQCEISSHTSQNTFVKDPSVS